MAISYIQIKAKGRGNTRGNKQQIQNNFEFEWFVWCKNEREQRAMTTALQVIATG